MITIRFLGNAKSTRIRFEVLRDGKIVGSVFLSGQYNIYDSGTRVMAIALRDFR